MKEIFAADALAGRRILITGGGTGLGRAMARRTAQLGADVIICGRREAVLAQAAEEISTELGVTVAAIPCDIREAADVTAMMDRIWAGGPLDALVNNAAGAILGRAETLSPRAFDAVLRVTLQGGIYCTLEAGKRWIESRRPGVVLSIVAAGVELGQPFTAPLTIAKSGMLTLTRTLAAEWGPKNIRCVAIGPGNIPTSGASQQLAGDRSRDPLERVPLRRLGDPGEIADLCVFLLSDAASYITGQMITVDGGAALVSQSTTDLFRWTAEQWELVRPKR